MTARAVASILIGMFCFASANAQEPSGFTGVMVGNGVYLKIWTHSEQGSTERRAIRGSVSKASTGPVHRLLLDETGTIVFGYDIELQTPADGRFLLVFRPLDQNDLERMWPSYQHRMVRPKGTIPTFAALRSTRLALGDQATIEVLRNPRTGETISDVIELTTSIVSANPGAASRAQRARESPESSSSIRLAAPRILISGTEVWRSGPGGLVSGRLVMFYLPGRGGYFFAADAQPGYDFARVASVDGTRMTFSIDGDVFECITEAAILPNEKAGFIWMLHDRTYVPTRGARGSSWHERLPVDLNGPFMGAASSYGDWVRTPQH